MTLATTVEGLRDGTVAPSTLTEVQWAAAAGAADVITAAFPVEVTSLVDGLILCTRALYANATTTPTFAADSTAAHTITKEGGQALAAGDIYGPGHELILRYNLAHTRWELLNPATLNAAAAAVAAAAAAASTAIAAAITANNNALEIFKSLTADDTGGQNVNTAQPWFPTAGAVDVEASTLYFFEGTLILSRSAGTTSHTFGILFGGTATLTSISYMAFCNENDTNDATANDSRIQFIDAATLATIKSASTSATEQITVRVMGIVRVNAAGTLIPQFQYSAAPGGAPTVKRGTHFRLKKVGTNVLASQGTWS